MSPFQTPVCVNPPWIQFLSAFNSPGVEVGRKLYHYFTTGPYGHHPGRWLAVWGFLEPTKNTWVVDGFLKEPMNQYTLLIDLRDWHWYTYDTVRIRMRNSASTMGYLLIPGFPGHQIHTHRIHVWYISLHIP